MVATKSIKESTSAERKLPSVCWIERAKQWSCKIGFNQTANGRQRAFQYLRFPFSQKNGVGQHQAKQAALAIRDQWDSIEVQWPDLRKGMEQMCEVLGETYDWSLPVWINSKFCVDLINRAKEKNGEELNGLQTAMQTTQENTKEQNANIAKQLVGLALSTSPAGVKKTINPLGEEIKKSAVTLRMAVDLWLASKKETVGLAAGKGVNANTYNGYDTAVNLAMQPLDENMSISDLNGEQLKKLVNFWMGLPTFTGKDGVEAKMKVRSAVGYCKAFKMFLNWLDDNEKLDWSKPKGTDSLFSFRGFGKTNIADYQKSLPKLKRLLANASERTRLYILLSLNLAAYKVDIANLLKSEVVERDAERFVWRTRNKTIHQDGYDVLHWLFPETTTLLDQEKAAKGDLFLLNAQGKQLQVAEVAKNKRDAIASAYSRLIKKIRNQDKKDGVTEKFSLSLKQLRKLGATAIKRIASDDTSRMYLGQKVPGQLGKYAQDDFGIVTASLKKWHQELKAADIFPA